MRTVSLLLLIVVASRSAGGCVQTAMLPADRVEKGDTRASFGVGVPGALFVPRLSAQVTRGLGGGDLTANLGVVPSSEQAIVGGGLAARSYLAVDMSIEAQLQGAVFSDRTAGLALVGLQTMPSGDGGWYVGAQTGVVRGPSPDVLVDGLGEERTWTAPVVGGTVGYGPFELGSSTRMQVELKANVPVWGDDGEAPPGATGLSIGVFGLFE